MSTTTRSRRPDRAPTTGWTPPLDLVIPEPVAEEPGADEPGPSGARDGGAHRPGLRLVGNGTDEPDWVLTPRERRVGRAGVAAARAALARAHPPRPEVPESLAG